MVWGLQTTRPYEHVRGLEHACVYYTSFCNNLPAAAKRVARWSIHRCELLAQPPPVAHFGNESPRKHEREPTTLLASSYSRERSPHRHLRLLPSLQEFASPVGLAATDSAPRRSLPGQPNAFLIAGVVVRVLCVRVQKLLLVDVAHVPAHAVNVRCEVDLYVPTKMRAREQTSCSMQPSRLCGVSRSSEANSPTNRVRYLTDNGANHEWSWRTGGSGLCLVWEEGLSYLENRRRWAVPCLGGGAFLPGEQEEVGSALSGRGAFSAWTLMRFGSKLS